MVDATTSRSITDSSEVQRAMSAAYEDGYNHAAKKACEWLRNHALDYYIESCQADNCYYDDEMMIEDFCKAMEG